MKLEKFREKNKKKMGIIIFTISCLLLVAGVYLYTSYALYEQNQNFNVIQGSVQDPGDISYVYYVDNILVRSMPNQNTGYALDTTKSSCSNGVTFSWDQSTWKLKANYSNYAAIQTTKTKCNLYFVKNTKVVSTVLGNIEVNNYTPDFTKSSCAASDCESHEAGIYETTDDDGTSYYYRGSVENNYVSFAGYYWRIIRINGNGSIRMIYDGTVAHANGDYSTDRYYTTSKFNESYADNMYAGYMYTNGDGHGTGTSSTIKNSIDNFYQEKLSSYANYLDTESGFCGDRNTLNLASGVGVRIVNTYYSGYLRVERSTPNLSCSNSNDYYTISTSSKGNKALTYPIGLVTADEVMLAGHGGGVFNGDQNLQKNNLGSYLNMGDSFWTITPVGGYNPFGADYWSAIVFYVYASGTLDDGLTIGDAGVRPVINIKSTVTISGSGTMSDPYVVGSD